jgi:hypothetical protein
MEHSEIEERLGRIRAIAETDWERAVMLESHLYMDVLNAIAENEIHDPQVAATLALGAGEIVMEAMPSPRGRSDG